MKPDQTSQPKNNRAVPPPGLDDNRVRLQTYTVSFFVSVLLLAIKFGAYRLTGSKAIFSDALESIINVITPAVGFWVIWISAKPADKEHPYGHGKLEYFSAALEGGLILFAAVMILVEAINSMIKGVELRSLDSGLVLIGAAGLVNLALGYYVLRKGEKSHSHALKANGRHILSDVWTTAGVIVGLFLVRLTGVTWFDPAAAVVVGVLLGLDGIRIVRESAGGLMDEEDESLLKILVELFSKFRRKGVIHIHHTRVIRSGRYHHIDAHIVVPQFWDVSTTHHETDIFEAAVIRDYPVDGEIHFHVDPCRRVYCRHCELDACPIRLESFESLVPFTVESLASPLEPEEFLKARRSTT